MTRPHIQKPMPGAQPGILIYGLFDPRTPNVIMYVGKANNAGKRLRTHIREARNAKCPTRKAKWILSLLAADVHPSVCILETVTRSNWRSRERYWIAHWRRLNPCMLNLADGGNGMTVTTAAIRKHLRAAFKDPTVRQRHTAALADPAFKLRHAEATRAALAVPETKEKLANALREAWQDPQYQTNHAAGMARARKGIAAAMRQRWQDPEYRRRQIAADRSNVGRANTGRTRAKVAVKKLDMSEQVAKAAALYQQGMTTTDIAVALGFKRGDGTSYTKRLLIKAGLR